MGTQTTRVPVVASLAPSALVSTPAGRVTRKNRS
jgi:hypothetical protein